MTYNSDIHHRRSIRLNDYNYSQAGAYFVTICARHRECLFGEIVNGKMTLSEMGRIVAEEWTWLESIRNNVVLDVFIIMPNHFHSIIFFTDSVGATPSARPAASGNIDGICGRSKGGRPVGIAPTGPVPGSIGAIMAQFKSRSKDGRPVGIAPTGPAPGSIGAIMAQFKSSVTKRINQFRNNPGCPVWQRNYYERIIRNDDELSRAREYIVNNPMKWELDKENPINCQIQIQ